MGHLDEIIVPVFRFESRWNIADPHSGTGHKPKMSVVEALSRMTTLLTILCRVNENMAKVQQAITDSLLHFLERQKGYSDSHPIRRHLNQFVHFSNDSVYVGILKAFYKVGNSFCAFWNNEQWSRCVNSLVSFVSVLSLEAIYWSTR